MPSGRSLGLIQSVAPNSRAIPNLDGLVSIAKILLAFLILLACIAANPTAPKPKTATVEFSSILQVFHTAPKPVLTPHPNKQILSRGADFSIFAQDISATTVYSKVGYLYFKENIYMYIYFLNTRKS